MTGLRPRAIANRMKSALQSVGRVLRRGDETKRATAFWRGLPDYHLSNDDEASALERSRWLADVAIPRLDVTSVLEVGTNSGRNLEIIKRAHPNLRLRGIDVNARAIEFARKKGLDIDFQVSDANSWGEPARTWDAVLTMSLMDHIPDDAIEELAANIESSSAKYIITVELWDGSAGERGLYKYSRDNRALFEACGVRTLLWEPSIGQYDLATSPLWTFIGAVQSPGEDAPPQPW